MVADPDVGQRAPHLPNVHLLSWGAAVGLGCGHTGGNGTAAAVVQLCACGELRSCGIWDRPFVSLVATMNPATVTVQLTQGVLESQAQQGDCRQTRVSGSLALQDTTFQRETWNFRQQLLRQLHPTGDSVRGIHAGHICFTGRMGLEIFSLIHLLLRQGLTI